LCCPVVLNKPIIPFCPPTPNPRPKQAKLQESLSHRVDIFVMGGLATRGRWPRRRPRRRRHSAQ
jgi:hypothetical protein